MERKLASIKIIRDIQPIEQADQIELALIDGWHSVVKKGQFRVGEKVIFCEPDSILPDQPDFEFMRSKKFKIKTCKLRGVTSQGICFPMSILVADWVNWNVVDKTNLPTHINDFPEGLDVSQILNITKYEPPIPTQLRGRIRGPTNRLAVPKTDEMRVQNIPGVLERHKGAKFHVNEKIDGTSFSVYLDPETGLHVCSRNLDLAPDHDHKYNGTAYWRYAIEHDLEDVLKSLGKTIALQGELFGEGIQKNKYGLKGLHYRVFNFWDMINHKYLEYDVMKDAVETFGLGKDFLVPDLGEIVLNHNVDDLLQIATGKSVLSDTLREGLVFRSIPESTDWELGRLSFKAVSPEFLLKWGE
jgi:RNA ligase (TIGR02306 family)